MKKENEEIIEEILIDEKSYQQIKKNMGKANDYFSIDEWKILGKKFSQFLASQFEIDKK